MTQNNSYDVLLKQTQVYIQTYIHNAGEYLTKKFSNGYEVNELVKEVDRLNYGIGRIAAEKIPDPDKFTLNSIVIKSPEQKFFEAAMTVVNRITDLEEYKHETSKNRFESWCKDDRYGFDPITSKEIEGICAKTPFFKKACEHLFALQDEAGDLPECVGQDFATHIDSNI